MINLTLENKLKKYSIISFYLYIISVFTFVDSAQFNYISQLCFITFVGFASFYILSRGTLHFHNIYFFWAIWLTWVLISCLYSIEINTAFSKFITLVQLCGLSIIMYEVFIDEVSVDEIIYALFIGGMFMCIYTIVYYGPNNMIMSMLNGNRLGSEISHENVLGMNAAITFVICFYLGVTIRKRRYLFVLPLPCFVALSTGSRKALLMIILGMIFMLITTYGIKKMYKTITIGIVISIILAIVINMPMFEVIKERMDGMFNLFTGTGKAEKSAEIRLDMIKFGIEKFKQKPLLGYGINNYRHLGLGAYAHNNYVELMVDTGIIGLIIYYFYQIYIVFKLVPNVKKKDYTANIILIIFLLNMSMDTARVSYDDKLMCIYLTLGFIYREVLNRKKKLRKI